MPTPERHLRRRREGLGLEPQEDPRSNALDLRKRPGATDALGSVRIEPDATLERHCELWEKKRTVKVSVSTMSRAARKPGWIF
jgi:hypothetical protein